MQRAIDKTILLGLCLLTLLIIDIQWFVIVALLYSLALTSLCEYLESRHTFLLCLAFVVSCFFVPLCILFLPIIVYDSMRLGKKGTASRLMRYSWCLALPWCYVTMEADISIMVSLIIACACVLEYKTSAIEKAHDDLCSITDDAKEKAAAMEDENRELMSRQDYEVRLATLTERNRIAREIHDNVGHLLTRSILLIDALQIKRNAEETNTNAPSASTAPAALQIKRSAEETSALPDDAKATGSRDLADIRDTLSEAMDSIRSSVHDLHDESVDLRAQLMKTTQSFNFCPVTLEYDAKELPYKIRTCFFAIVKEALNNIALHSRATKASIAINEHPGFCQLIIWDNGKKQASEELSSPGKNDGIGLTNMRDRVYALGGIFRAECEDGFRIFITIPKT